MDQLFELIIQMNPSEKGYFKKGAADAGENTPNDYLRLFDAISAQKEYDEAALRKQFEKESWVKNFAVTKRYLYERLLVSLAAYHQNHYIEPQVMLLHTQARILTDKGLYAQAFKLLKKAAGLAETYELTGLRLQLHLLERKLYLLQPFEKEAHYPLQNLRTRLSGLALLVQEYTQLLDLHYRQLGLMYDSYFLKDSDKQQEHERIYREALQHRTKEHISGILLSDILINYHSANAQYEASYHELSKALEETKSHPYFNQYDQISLVILYDLLLTDCLRTGRKKEFVKHLFDFRDHSWQNEPVKISAHLSYARFALVYYDAIQDREQLMKLTEETFLAVKSYGARIRKDLHLAVNIAFSSAMLEYGEYPQALNWLQLYQQYPKQDRHYDYQGVLLLFQLIAHFELGNFEYVGNVLENVAYFLKKNKQEAVPEKVALKAFKLLLVQGSSNKQQQKIEALIKELQDYVQTHPAAVNNVSVPILRSFLESKLAGKPYHVYVKSA